MRRKYKRGGLSNKEASKQGIGSGVQRATNLANGDAVSPDTIGRMVSFFARHEKNKDSKTPGGEPGAGQIAWLLWGGDPGQRWAKKTKRQMEAADMKSKSLVQLASQIITIRSEASVIPQPLTYKSGGHTGAMIALFLPVSTGIHFIQSDPQALPPNELHVTLAYLGKAADISSRQIMETHDLMKLISENHPPLTGHINGCGRFCNDDDDGDPFFIIPDLPALPNLRQAIIDGLNSHDIEGASDHGFVPHITLTYLPHAECNPFDILERTPVTFPAISLVLGDDRYDYPLAQDVPLLSKAALIEKIGARHTSAECGTIQKMHDLAIELGAECYPLTRRAGARHSHADQALVQRIHDDCSGLGATCKALPEKDRVCSSQVLKEGPTVERGGPGSGRPKENGVQSSLGDLQSQQGRDKYITNLGSPLEWSDEKRTKIVSTLQDNFSKEEIEERETSAKGKQKAAPKGSKQAANSGAFAAIFAEVLAGLSKKSFAAKAQSDAPNYRPADTPQRCANCRFFLGDPGRDWCELFDFTADPDYVSDAWGAQRPDEIPGYVANKGDLAALTEGILTLRRNPTKLT
jgi:2'-5' RNA ligase